MSFRVRKITLLNPQNDLKFDRAKTLCESESIEKASVCYFSVTFGLIIDQSDVLSPGFCFLRRIWTVLTSEISGMRRSTLGLFGRSLDFTTVSSAPSNSFPSPLMVHINQSLVGSFAQAIQNTPCANL